MADGAQGSLECRSLADKRTFLALHLIYGWLCG